MVKEAIWQVLQEPVAGQAQHFSSQPELPQLPSWNSLQAKELLGCLLPAKQVL